MTMFYATASGGVRTYLDAKHRRLKLYPGVRHSVLVPGRRYAHEAGLHRVPAPLLPFSRGHRFPLRRAPWRDLLQALRPELIEVGDPYVTAWAALDAGRRLGIPVVGFYHSDLPLLASNRFGQWAGRRCDPYVVKLYRQFNRVLAPSTVVADKLEALGLQSVFIQPLGVDLDLFNPQHCDDTLRQRLRLPDHTRLLVYAGRGAREKNLPVLLETMRRLGAPYHLLLIGSGMPRRVPANVSVLRRFCPAQEVARLVASCDVFLHAGTQETFGLVALEAMACGLPVVAANAGALPEIVPFFAGRVCEPFDPASMAAAVREVYEADPYLLGRKARQHVEAHHAWDAVVAGLITHYQAVLGSVELPVAVHG